jgi:cysteine desulfurase / selenocysteine lyase
VDLTQRLALRADTPGIVHAEGRVHLNHAGASLPPNSVFAAIQQHLLLETKLGAMEAAQQTADRVQSGRQQLAHLINAQAGEIAFCSSGSFAHGLAVASIGKLRAGDRIVVSRQEWGGNLASYQYLADAAGASIEVMPHLPDGRVDVMELANRLDDRVKLLSLTWLPASGGLIHDAAAIGQLARAANVPYWIDAGQAVGQLPVDVQSLGCDVLKSAGRKHLRGPRGTGFLYARRAFLEHTMPVFLSTHAASWQTGQLQLQNDARRYECPEHSNALTLGLLAAVELASSIDIAASFRYVQELAVQLRRALQNIDRVSLCDLGPADQRSGIVAFNIDGIDAMAVKSQLAALQCTVGANGVAYTPLDMQARGLAGIVRVSLSYLNDAEDIEQLIRAVQRLCLR